MTTISSTGLTTDHHAVCAAVADYGSVRALRLRHKAGLMLEEHAHERACFSLGIAGSFAETFQRRTLTSEDHAVLFRPANAVHSDAYGSESADDVVLEMHESWMQRLCEGQKGAFNAPAVYNGAQNAHIAQQLLLEMAFADNASAIAIEGFTLQIASQFIRRNVAERSSVPPRWLRQARDMIDVSYSEPMSLLSISQSVGVHPVHLSKQFPRYFGCSVSGFIQLRRVHHAQQELRYSNASIAQIALRVGFADQAHFNRVFKRITGLTPATYRRQAG